MVHRVGVNQAQRPQRPEPGLAGHDAAIDLSSAADGQTDGLDLSPVDGEAIPHLQAPTEPESRSARSRSRGMDMLVEFVRLVMVALFAVGGWQVASNVGSVSSPHLLVGIVLGSMIGFVIGGVFGRQAATAASQVEREFRRIPASELLSGFLGLVVGLLPAALLSVPLFHLPLMAALPTVALLYVIMGLLGYRIGRAKSDELLGTFGVKPRAAGMRQGEVAVLDTSAILDGRILSLVRMGFLRGSLLVARSVLRELQTIADSTDHARRARGRAGLDTLVTMRRDPSVEVVLVEDDERPDGGDVDAGLVRLARDRGGVLVTNDANLSKVAAALDVPVRSIHALAAALRPQVIAGDLVAVRLLRKGRDAGQAVGYLDDGTMVVVEDARSQIGATVQVEVANVLQTATGQMVFARLPEGGEAGAAEPAGERDADQGRGAGP